MCTSSGRRGRARDDQWDVGILVLIVRFLSVSEVFVAIRAIRELAAEVLTRFAVLRLAFGAFFETQFLLYFSPLALLGLLYTIVRRSGRPQACTG